MTNHAFAVVLVCTLFSAALADAQDDVANQLEKAKTAYFASEEDFDESINDWFDSQEQRARKRGDRDSVIKIKSARKAFA